MNGEATIEEWLPTASGAPELERDLEMLAGVLLAAVHGGASVSFILPFEKEDALRFWRDAVLPAVRKGGKRVLLARLDGRIVGTAQLALDTPPNQAHRAEVSKLLVHPDVRRRGIARALMSGVEKIALQEGRTLLTLDTRTGDAAEPLYLSMGYTLAGIIPRFARGPFTPDLEPTSILYKELALNTVPGTQPRH